MKKHKISYTSYADDTQLYSTIASTDLCPIN